MFCLHEIKGTTFPFNPSFNSEKLRLIPPLKEPRIQRNKASLMPFNPSFIKGRFK